MRDFIKEIRNAARFDGTVLAPEFSWSLSRDRLFRFCRRAYFIRYYLAQGGWDEYAHPLHQAAWREKNLISLTGWLSEQWSDAVTHALRRTLSSRPDARKREFLLLLLRRISTGTTCLLESLKNREYLEDPAGKPGILEYHYACSPERELERISCAAVARLSAAYGQMRGNACGILGELLALDCMDFRTNDAPCCFDYHGVPVWFAPNLLYFRKNTVRMLKFEFADSDLEDSVYGMEAAVFSEYTRLNWPDYQSGFCVLCFSENGGAKLHEPAPCDPKDRMTAGIAEMRALIGEDGMVHLEDFPLAEDMNHCGHCRFRNSCRLLSDI